MCLSAWAVLGQGGGAAGHQPGAKGLLAFSVRPRAELLKSPGGGGEGGTEAGKGRGFPLLLCQHPVPGRCPHLYLPPSAPPPLSDPLSKKPEPSPKVAAQLLNLPLAVPGRGVGGLVLVAGMHSLLRWSAEPRLPGEHIHSSHLLATSILRLTAPPASRACQNPSGNQPLSPGSLGQRRRIHHALSCRRCLAHPLTPKLPAATDRSGAGGWVEQGDRPDSRESLPRHPPLPSTFQPWVCSKPPPHTPSPPQPLLPHKCTCVGVSVWRGVLRKHLGLPLTPAHSPSNPRDPKNQANGDTQGVSEGSL